MTSKGISFSNRVLINSSSKALDRSPKASQIEPHLLRNNLVAGVDHKVFSKKIVAGNLIYSLNRP